MQKFNTNIASNISFIKTENVTEKWARNVYTLNVRMGSASQTAYTMGMFEIKDVEKKNNRKASK